MSGCKKTFFLRKINLSNHKSYEKEINKKFEDVDEYFDTSNKIIIGKRINFSPLSEIAENGVRGGAVGFRRTVRMKKPTIRNVKNEELSPHQKVYEILDEDSIKNLFDKIKENTENNRKKNTISMKTLPKNIQSNLRYQTNSLNTKNRNDKHIRSLSNFLISKTKKKKNDLLLNSTEKFRIKTEVMKSIENSVPYETKNGINNWSVSLRRPKNFKGVRTAMINMGTDSRPFWGYIRERNPVENEVVLKSETDNTKEEMRNINFYTSNLHFHTQSSILNDKLNLNNYYYNTIMNNNEMKKIDNLDDLNKLSLCGKKLIDIEYQNAVNIKGKVIIKKNNPITIHEKIMNEAINGDETIYENYGKNKVCLSETSTSQTHLFC